VKYRQAGVIRRHSSKFLPRSLCRRTPRLGRSQPAWALGAGSFHWFGRTILDHTRWLGGTLAEIAREKAGIVKFGAPVVSAAQAPEAAAALAQRAAAAGSFLEFIQTPFERTEIGLRGVHQKENAALAVAALRAAGVMVSDEAVE
jgi:hypothetical protein